MIAERFLEGPAPVNARARGRTVHQALASVEVTGADYFNLGCVDGRESWGVLATVNRGAIAVPAELAKAAELPSLPKDLARIATKVGPVNDQLRRAILLARRNPDDTELQEAVIHAAVEHAQLHESLRVWRPAPAFQSPSHPRY
jgi:hypothetical protein